MRHLHWLSLVGLTRLATLTSAADVVYVTDLEIYTLLAPCAASAISADVFAATYTTGCGDDEKALQSCVCSSADLSKSVWSSISSDLTWSCGSSATDDFSSASQMMDLYCDQALSITFPTPTKNVVNAYITDLPQLDYLPPCAQSALSYAVMGAGYERCPEAAQLYAPCVCSKEDLVSSVSETIRSSVKYSCSNNDDVTSAYKFYNEYCAMNEGTTSFATPDGPPGDMTYYITGLPEFKSLRGCAQSGVSSAIMEQSSWLCGSGPQELASCACIKSGMFNYVSSLLTEGVKGYCDNTATADVTSALDLLKYYCSAAESKVVVTVKDAVSQTYPTADTASAAGSGPGKTGAAKTSSINQETGAAGNGSSNANDGEDSTGVSIAPIAGGVAAGVAVVALGLGVFFFLRRRQQKQKRGEQIPSSQDGNTFPPNDFNGKPELMGSALGTPAGKTAELSVPHHTPRPELDGGGKQIMELPPNQAPTSELHGQSPPGYASPYGHPSPQKGYMNAQQMPQELSSPGYGYQPSPQLNGQPVYEFPAHPQPTQHRPPGAGWQSGPVEAYEMDANVGRRQG
ncbi:Fc.00g114080.m01.CDS01 [Cosmosporella sp. VM-42]